MTGFINTSITIAMNYNSSQLMTAWDSLHSLLDYECLLFHCDRLGSDLRIGHFFNFLCLLVNTPQLNIQLLNSLTTESESLTNSITRGEWREITTSNSSTVTASIRCSMNVLTEPLPSNVLFRIYSLPRERLYLTVAQQGRNEFLN
jgi:hypothetical protein